MAEAQGIDGDGRSACVGSAVFDALRGAIRGPVSSHSVPANHPKRPAGGTRVNDTSGSAKVVPSSAEKRRE